MSVALERDIGSHIKVVKGINPEDSAAQTINGAAIDRTGFLSCVLHHACGAETGAPTSKTIDSKLQDSPDGSAPWADYGTAATQLTADNSEAEVDIDLSAAKKFIRVVETVAFVGGTSPTVPVNASVVLGGSDQKQV